MAIEKPTESIEKFQMHKTDTGSTAVQIVEFTNRINHLAKHLEINKKDHSSRLGLLKMVGHRRRLLNFLNRNDSAQHKAVLTQLKLRK